MFSLVKAFRVNGLSVKIMMDLDGDEFIQSFGSYCYFVEDPADLDSEPECRFCYETLEECEKDAKEAAKNFYA